MYDLHFHTVEPVYSNEDYIHDICDAIANDFNEGHYIKEDDPFWFGVTLPFDKEVEDPELDTLKIKVSHVLSDIPTIWKVKSIIQDKPERLIFLVDVGGPLGR